MAGIRGALCVLVVCILTVECYRTKINYLNQKCGSTIMVSTAEIIRFDYGADIREEDCEIKLEAYDPVNKFENINIHLRFLDLDLTCEQATIIIDKFDSSRDISGTGRNYQHSGIGVSICGDETPSTIYESNLKRMSINFHKKVPSIFEGMFEILVTKVNNGLCDTENEFECTDGPCVDMKLACDDYYNCKDESDEIEGCFWMAGVIAGVVIAIILVIVIIAGLVFLGCRKIKGGYLFKKKISIPVAQIHSNEEPYFADTTTPQAKSLVPTYAPSLTLSVSSNQSQKRLVSSFQENDKPRRNFGFSQTNDDTHTAVNELPKQNGTGRLQAKKVDPPIVQPVPNIDDPITVVNNVSNTDNSKDSDVFVEETDLSDKPYEKKDKSSRYSDRDRDRGRDRPVKYDDTSMTDSRSDIDNTRNTKRYDRERSPDSSKRGHTEYDRHDSRPGEYGERDRRKSKSRERRDDRDRPANRSRDYDERERRGSKSRERDDHERRGSRSRKQDDHDRPESRSQERDDHERRERDDHERRPRDDHDRRGSRSRERDDRERRTSRSREGSDRDKRGSRSSKDRDTRDSRSYNRRKEPKAGDSFDDLSEQSYDPDYKSRDRNGSRSRERKARESRNSRRRDRYASTESTYSSDSRLEQDSYDDDYDRDSRRRRDERRHSGSRRRSRSREEFRKDRDDREHEKDERSPRNSNLNRGKYSPANVTKNKNSMQTVI